jgi:hypothetical protein
MPDPRIEAALLTWLKQADSTMLYRERDIFDDLKRALNVDPSADLTNRLLSLAAGVPNANVRLILRVLNGDRKLGDPLFDQFLQQYGKQPVMRGFIEYLQSTGDWPHLQALYEADSSTTEDIRFIALSGLLSGSLAYRGDAEFLNWMRQTSLTAYQEKRWKPEQAIDMFLALHHADRQAAERLYHSGSSAGYLVRLDGRMEQMIAEMHPQSDLVMGIKAYEEIRGQPYFIRPEKNDWYTPEGDDYTNPQKAILEWRAFLKEYPHHPAADDAAYRLARCEAMTGQYSAALRDFVLSLSSGDRDMAYDSSGMLMYTLDTAMSTKDFIGLKTEDLPEWMLPWLEYTKSVNLIRDRHYAEAKQALQDFVDHYKDANLFASLPQSSTPQYQMEIWKGEPAFWTNISTQLSDITHLAVLSAKADAASSKNRQTLLYEIAAYIYHHPMIYYNNLWEGGRAAFLGFEVRSADMRTYETRFNPYVQAAAAFSAIDLQQADPHTGANTLFSLALSYSKMIDFGQESGFYDTRTHMAQAVANYAQQLIDRYPDSNLADDSEMLIFNYTGNKNRLQAILDNYPDGDQADDAKRLKSKKDSGTQPNRLQTSFYTGQKLRPGDWRLPNEVSAWMDAHQDENYQGWKVSEDYIYVYVSSARGSYVNLTGITIKPDGAVISYSRNPLPKNRGYSMAVRSRRLIRLPASFVDTQQLSWSTK